MKIALPIANNLLCMHFGHCEQFAFIDVDEKEKKITNKELLTPPPHEPGVIPKWVHEQGADLVLAGGMGQRARSLFEQQGVKVIVGVPAGKPEDIVDDYLNNRLVTGHNACDH
ncbi:MAG: ATPase [Clostridia bacterium]|nr:ATPase [Clostridia bacterium]